MAMRLKEKKFEISQDGEYPTEDLQDHILPESYNETKILLLLRDPFWAFSYWELNSKDKEILEKNEGISSLMLRVFVVDLNHKGNFFAIPVSEKDRSWYINLPYQGTKYLVSLVQRIGENEKTLCTSNTIISPKLQLHPEQNGAVSKDLTQIMQIGGIGSLEDESIRDMVPQRIISQLDADYLNLKD